MCFYDFQDLVCSSVKYKFLKYFIWLGHTDIHTQLSISQSQYLSFILTLILGCLTFTPLVDRVHQHLLVLNIKLHTTSHIPQNKKQPNVLDATSIYVFATFS